MLLRQRVIPAYKVGLLGSLEVVQATLHRPDGNTKADVAALDFQLPTAVVIPKHTALTEIPEVYEASYSRVVKVNSSLTVAHAARPLVVLGGLEFSAMLNYSPGDLAVQFPGYLQDRT